MAEIKQRSLEEVKALSIEEAVEIMRQAGIVGAGGGGFPTYFKYKSPQPHLIVNATESEPGYWGDKLLHKEHLEEFLQVFDALKTIFGFEQISMGVHEKDREWFADYAEHADDGVFDVRYVPNTYALGEEKTLVKHATDTRVPRFVDTPDGIRRPGCRRMSARSLTTRKPCSTSTTRSSWASPSPRSSSRSTARRWT
jgi:Na+-translocating ferredoxin:NAD+ oxidoreductase RnfC subunit